MPDPIRFPAWPCPRRLRHLRSGGLLLLLGALVAGCAGLPGGPSEPEAEEEAAATSAPAGNGPEPPPWTASERDRAIEHVLAAEIAARRERFDQALEHYLAAMELTSDRRAAERAVQLSFVLEEEEQAQQAAQRWRELAPEQAEAYELLGLLALRRGDLDVARDDLQQAIERWPGTPGQAFLRLPRLLSHGIDPEAALTVLSELAEAHADVPEAHRAVAVVAERADQPERALAAAERAFEIAPTDREAGRTLLRALAVAEQGEVIATDDALAELERLRQVQPALIPQAALLEGDLKRRAGRLEAAEAAYARGLEEAPEHADLRYGRGLARAARGDTDGALADLRRVHEAEPEAPHVLNALGYTLADAGRELERARELIERALDAAPDNPAFLDSKGWLLYREGELEAALAYLERAFEVKPHAEIGAHLGEVLWELEERERARAVWRKAYEQGAEDPVLRETLERYEVDPDAW